MASNLIQSSLSATVSGHAATFTAEASELVQGGWPVTGNAVFATMKVIPSALVWLAAFATFTLPAWLFTGLSTSLTFTVNMTTL